MSDELEIRFETITKEQITAFHDHCALQLQTLLKIKLELEVLMQNNQVLNIRAYYQEIKTTIEQYSKLKNTLNTLKNISSKTNKNSEKINAIKELISLDKKSIEKTFFKDQHKAENLLVNAREFKNRAKLFLVGTVKLLAGILGIIGGGLFATATSPTAVGFIGGVNAVILSAILGASGLSNIQEAIFETEDQKKKRVAETQDARRQISRLNEHTSLFATCARNLTLTPTNKPILKPTPVSAFTIRMT